MLKKLLVLAVLLWVSKSAFGQVIENVDTAWVRRYNGPGNAEDVASCIAIDHSGNIYVAGYSVGSGPYHDYATIKYYPNGDTAWVRRYNGPGNGDDEARAIVVDDSGYVYVTGFSDGSGTSADYATIKYKPNGDTLWVRRYNGPGNDYDFANAIGVDGMGNVYVTGYSMGSGTLYDYATLRYDRNGNQLWVMRYNGPLNGNDNAYALALDESGNIYVTGESDPDGHYYYDYLTIKYNSNGDTLWERRYNGPADNVDEARAIAVDHAGNVYVTGQSYGIGTQEDYATVKYYPNGEFAWVSRYNGPANGEDWAFDVVAENPDNIYVTGLSYAPATIGDYATLKYYSTGDDAWVRRYNGPGNSNDYAVALTLDAPGKIYVTGYSYGSGTSLDYTTIKYNPDGGERWIHRYNGPGNAEDRAYAVSVDDFGHVYVTGKSWGSGTDYDYATIKYVQSAQRIDTLIISVYSPVDIVVTDPRSDSIGINFNTIPSAKYDTSQDVNHDGEKDDIVTIPNPLVGQYMVRVVAEPGGSGTYTEAIKLDGNEATVVVLNAQVPGPGQVDTVVYNVPEYLHGDANRDGKKTVSDVVFLINYLFKGGPAPDPVSLGDVNFCKQNPPVEPGQPTVADVIYMVNYLFKGGPAPCS